MKIQDVGLTPHMWVIKEHLKKGYYIEVITDNRQHQTDRVVTDDQGNDIMSVNWKTFEALLRKEIIEETTTWKGCIEVEIRKYILRQPIRYERRQEHSTTIESVPIGG